MLYNDYNTVAAPCMASLLALVALVLNSALEWRFNAEIAAGSHR